MTIRLFIVSSTLDGVKEHPKKTMLHILSADFSFNSIKQNMKVFGEEFGEKIVNLNHIKKNEISSSLENDPVKKDPVAELLQSIKNKEDLFLTKAKPSANDPYKKAAT